MSRRGCRNISYPDRIKIEALFQAGHRPASIAVGVGFSVSAIYRELKRGYYYRLNSELVTYLSYSADIAQKDYDFKASNKGSSLKLAHDYDFVSYIETKIIQEKYSPSAALEKMKQESHSFSTCVCVKTLYNYIANDVFLHLSNQNLLRKSTLKRGYHKVQIVRIKRPLACSIEERNPSIEQRQFFGHWEMDTVIGKAKGKGQVLLVLTERQTRYEIIRKINAKTQFEVLRALNRLERQYGKDFSRIFLSITVDNGSEFLKPELLERSCLYKRKRRTVIYYCHPYSSWERGSNENQNGMIRRFIPKGTPLENYTHSDIATIECWMNSYPRKILDWGCSEALFQQSIWTL